MNELPLIAPDHTKVIYLADETRFAANGIVSRTILHTAPARVVLFGFAEGQELNEHTSTRPALIEILFGECDFSLEGEWQSLKAGAFLHMSPNLRHAVRAKQPFSTLIKPAHAPKSGPGDGHCGSREPTTNENTKSQQMERGRV
jgi:quercetin dioxygenase-like cupin family protein